MKINYFDEGFTERSYLNICKQIAVGLYKNITWQDLNFNFSDENEINAWASLDEYERDKLVINVKTVVDVFALMKTVFSQKELYIKIGNISKENNNIIVGMFNKSNKQIIYTADPQDEVRKIISDYAAIIAIRFILTHELGHIMNGHTKYLNSLYLKSKIGMCLEKVSNNTKYCLDRRTMEMDADAAAITSSFDNIAMLYKSHSTENPISLLNKKEDIFSIWSFSIAAIFMLFEKDMPSDYDENSYYLPNKARFMMAMNAAYETAKAYVKHDIVSELETNKYDIIMAVRIGVEECELFFKKVYNKEFGWSKIFLETDERYRCYSSEVLENWDNKLKKELEKYSKVPLYDKYKVDEIMEAIKNPE